MACTFCVRIDLLTFCTHFHGFRIVPPLGHVYSAMADVLVVIPAVDWKIRILQPLRSEVSRKAVSDISRADTDADAD